MFARYPPPALSLSLSSRSLSPYPTPLVSAPLAFHSRSPSSLPGPFRARREKFTIVCRGTAIAPPRRPASDKKARRELRQKPRACVTRSKWKLQRFSGTLHGGRRNYDCITSKAEITTVRLAKRSASARHDPLLWRVRGGGRREGEGGKNCSDARHGDRDHLEFWDVNGASAFFAMLLSPPAGCEWYESSSASRKIGASWITIFPLAVGINRKVST